MRPTDTLMSVDDGLQNLPPISTPNRFTFTPFLVDITGFGNTSTEIAAMGSHASDETALIPTDFSTGRGPRRASDHHNRLRFPSLTFPSFSTTNQPSNLPPLRPSSSTQRRRSATQTGRSVQFGPAPHIKAGRARSLISDFYFLKEFRCITVVKPILNVFRTRYPQNYIFWNGCWEPSVCW